MASIEHIIPNKEKALMLAKRQLPELVCDAVNLEGINFTLPEVQTLLEGVTIGGHVLSDQTITTNQAKAWSLLFKWIKEGSFDLTAKRACELHSVAAFEEALKSGKFRDGNVTIAGTKYTPAAPNELSTLWQNMCDQAKAITDVYDQAIFIFLEMARQQFFYDVNKRMGRFMMNGLLLSQGYPAINLPASKKAQFNQLMLDFYPSGDVSDMTTFMKNCLDERVIAIMCEQ